MSSILIEVPVDPQTCRHENIGEIGRDGKAVFYRCDACGSIIISDGPHRWIIRPTDEGGPLPF